MHSAAGVDSITADKMSEFYKLFLNKNRKLHVLYNFSWYIKNFQLLFLSLRVEVVNIFKLKVNGK